MKTVITVSIKETSPKVWRLTLDGQTLGDSRGYSKAEAIEQAKRQAAKTDDGRWEGSLWVPIQFRLEL